MTTLTLDNLRIVATNMGLEIDQLILIDGKMEEEGEVLLTAEAAMVVMANHASDMDVMDMAGVGVYFFRHEGFKFIIASGISANDVKEVALGKEDDFSVVSLVTAVRILEGRHSTLNNNTPEEVDMKAMMNEVNKEINKIKVTIPQETDKVVLDAINNISEMPKSVTEETETTKRSRINVRGIAKLGLGIAVVGLAGYGLYKLCSSND